MCSNELPESNMPNAIIVDFEGVNILASNLIVMPRTGFDVPHRSANHVQFTPLEACTDTERKALEQRLNNMEYKFIKTENNVDYWGPN